MRIVLATAYGSDNMTDPAVRGEEVSEKAMKGLKVWIEHPRLEADKAEAPDGGKEEPVDQLEEVAFSAHAFIESMNSLWKYTSGVGAAAETTGMLNLFELTNLLLELGATSSGDARERLATLICEFSPDDAAASGQAPKRVEFPIFDRENYNNCDNLISASRRAIGLLHQTALQQLVVLFERLLGEIVFAAVLADSDNIFVEEPVKLGDLLKMSSFYEAKEAVAYNQAKQFLRDPFNKQIEFIESKLKIDVKRLYKRNLPRLKECIVRRHAIVHGTSFSINAYWLERNRISGLSKSDRSENVMWPSADYVRESWDVVYSAGVIIVHALLVRGIGLANSEELREHRTAQADRVILNATYAALKGRRNQAAIDILDYYLDVVGKDGILSDMRLMATINRAQAYKWLGEEERASRELSKMPVGVLGPRFRVCIAALRDDEVELWRAMDAAIDAEEIKISEVFEWPVFQKVRRMPNFRERIAERFGVSEEEIRYSKEVPFVMSPPLQVLKRQMEKIQTIAEEIRARSPEAFE